MNNLSLPSKQSRLAFRSLLTITIFLLLASNIALLWIKRDYFVSGWGLLGFAEGSWTCYQKGFIESVAKFWSASRSYQYWGATNSVIYPVLSGILHNWKPWPFWGHLLSLVLFFSLSFWCLSSLNLEKRVFYAAIGTSPVLLSFSIVASPVISCVIPYSLALIVLFSFQGDKEGNWKILILELIAWLFVYEISFHCYELSKTVAILPLIAAFTLPGLRTGRRVMWAGIGIAMGYGLLFHYSSTAAARLGHFATHYEKAIPSLYAVFRGLWIEWYSDLPFLITAGIISLLLLREKKWFWRFLFASQVALVLMEATRQGLVDMGVRPRRMVMLNFLSALVLAQVWCDLKSTKAKSFFVILLCVGHVFTLRSTITFLKNPPVNRALPYIHSPADFRIDKPLIRDAKLLTDMTRSSDNIHFLSYGYSKYAENTTDPAAFPERVLLNLGPKEFSEKIFFIDYKKSRYSNLPMHSLDQFVEKAASMNSGFYLHVYSGKKNNPMLIYAHRDFPSFVRRYLNRSDLTPVDLGFHYFDSYRIENFRLPGPVEIPESRIETKERIEKDHKATLCYSNYTSRYVWKLFREVQKAADNPPEVDASVPFEIKVDSSQSIYFEGIYANRSGEPIAVTIETSADDSLAVMINGQTVAHYYAEKWPPSPIIARVILPKGLNHLQIFFGNWNSRGWIKFSSRTDEGAELPWSCPGRVRNES